MQKSYGDSLSYGRDFSKEFQSDSCKLLFFKDNPNLPKGRIVDAKEAHKVIGSKYNAADIFCGPLDKKESSYIFDKKAEVLDCVLVPIKNSECPGVLRLVQGQRILILKRMIPCFWNSFQKLFLN